MNPEDNCIVCGQQDARGHYKASWGPVTLYYHSDCIDYYQQGLAPRLRDSVVRTIRRWILQDQPTIARPFPKDTHEPEHP